MPVSPHCGHLHCAITSTLIRPQTCVPGVWVMCRNSVLAHTGPWDVSHCAPCLLVCKAKQMFLKAAWPEEPSQEHSVLTQGSYSSPGPGNSRELGRTTPSPGARAPLCTLDVCPALPGVFLVPHSVHTLDMHLFSLWQGMTPSFPFSVSLLALRNDEAVLVLCYAVLEGNCLSSMITTAWKEMEKRVLGFGDSVCDNLGRHHTDLCPDCAFCSLKREQCQNIESLNRVPCDSGKEAWLTLSHPLQSTSSQSLSDDNMNFLRGMRMEYWCSRMAIYGCNDPAVTLWLKAEYETFPDMDSSGKICDSSGVQHPNFCMFKSYQCLLNSIYNERVVRVKCSRNMAYRVLSAKEGEKEVKLWQERFQSLTRKQPQK
uniref:Acrosin-binding protein n=1 Tax=Zonotrichia albicollis TaxID=44394 RepID=A0A8D2NJG9_ZONAL